MSAKNTFRPKRGHAKTMIDNAVILKKGELFVEIEEGTTVGNGRVKIKIGNGVNTYGKLPYAIDLDNAHVENLANEKIKFDDSKEKTRDKLLAEMNEESFGTVMGSIRKFLKLADESFTDISKNYVTLTGKQALTNKTYNGYTLADACAKNVVDRSTPTALGTSDDLITERAVYYSLPLINNSKAYTSNGTIYAPTTGGSTEKQVLVSQGSDKAPIWHPKSDSVNASPIGSTDGFTTERDIYYGLPVINNSHSYTSNSSIYAPTTGGVTGQILRSVGTATAPEWVDVAKVVSKEFINEQLGDTAITADQIASALGGRVALIQKQTASTDAWNARINNVMSFSLSEGAPLIFLFLVATSTETKLGRYKVSKLTMMTVTSSTTDNSWKFHHNAIGGYGSVGDYIVINKTLASHPCTISLDVKKGNYAYISMYTLDTKKILSENKTEG